MAIIVLDPGESFEHWHSDDSITELHSGRVRCRFSGKVVVLSPGEKIEIPAGVDHTLENFGSEKAYVGCTHGPCGPDGADADGPGGPRFPAPPPPPPPRPAR